MPTSTTAYRAIVFDYVGVIDFYGGATKNEDGQNISLNTELISMIPTLKKQGLAIAIFSNYTTRLRTELENKNVAHYFDEIVLSGEIEFYKPQKKAFEILFDTLKVRPEEVIFIDDTISNLEGAKEIGYTPILFKNNEQLKADLLHLGISV